MITQEKKAKINRQLQQVDSLLQETIDKQYTISSKDEFFQFYQDNTPKVYEVRQMVKNILTDI